MPKVLIIDDDPAVVATFARMLRLEGYDVVTALDAQAGLREVEAFQPDAVLLDLRMPHMDAVAFLRQLRARTGLRHTPVAVVTGDYFVDDGIERELRDLESHLYFKPLWLDDLVRITAWLIHKIK
jgi:CheY-like chemotaxis protein